MPTCCLKTPTCGKHCTNSSFTASMQTTDNPKFTFMAHKYNIGETWVLDSRLPFCIVLTDVWGRFETLTGWMATQRQWSKSLQRSRYDTKRQVNQSCYMEGGDRTCRKQAVSRLKNWRRHKLHFFILRFLTLSRGDLRWRLSTYLLLGMCSPRIDI